MVTDTIPQDILERARGLWVDALNDGTPDAAFIIAQALLAERAAQREKDAGIAEVWERTVPADDTTMAKVIATAMSEAGKETAKAIRNQQ